MAERWRILALLFSIRTVFAFQFATVGALGPLVGETFQVDAAGVGLLVGLYLSPGLLIALPGGAIGRLFGDKRTVAGALVLMTLGGAVSAFGAAWEAQLAGRVLAGVGGVVLNVLMTKMVADWFAGREISTAMGIFVNSYPVGIAVALVAQPLVAEAGGVPAAFGLTAVLAAAGCAALMLRYRPADGATTGRGGFPRGRGLCALLLGASVWGLYNAALLMVVSFAPILLHGRGWSLDEAGSATSLSLWALAAILPFGGLVADRTGRVGLIIVAGCGLTALAMVALPRVESEASVYALLILIGLVAGAPPGPIMSLPARVLAPETRALGMGLFFTVFYLFMFIGPSAAGALLEASGWDGAALDLGAALAVAAIATFWGFERVVRRL